MRRVTEIIPEVLYQGNFEELGRALEYDLVVSAAVEWPPPSWVRFIYLPLEDVDIDWRKHKNWSSKVIRTALMIVDEIQAGRKVLVVCQAGLNRSGLVVALVLVFLGLSPKKAIQMLRQKRSSYVLYNKSFVDMVKGVGLEWDKMK
jgi:hypothetical protein